MGILAPALTHAIPYVAENRRAGVCAQCDSETANQTGENWDGSERIENETAKTAVAFSSRSLADQLVSLSDQTLLR
jgi:hypothetical protein